MNGILKAVSIFAAAMCFALVACGGGTTAAGGVSAGGAGAGGGGQRAVPNDLFDQMEPAIEKVFGKLSQRLEAGARAALFPPGSTDRDAANYVFEKLYERFIDAGYNMAERKDIERAIEEIEFGMSGLVDDDMAARAGRFLGAQVIVFGDLPEIGTARQRIVFRALEVETGRMLGISSERF